jgi:hypothetical protein
MIRDETAFNEAEIFMKNKREEIEVLTRECEGLRSKNMHANLKAQ